MLKGYTILSKNTFYFKTILSTFNALRYFEESKVKVKLFYFFIHLQEPYGPMHSEY